MPMIYTPNAPTAPALGKSSNVITQGYFDTELQPFVQMGGIIEGTDPGINIAGGARLGRHMFLKGPEEQKTIMSNIRTNRLKQFVTERLGEGYTKLDEKRLRRSQDGYTHDININWETGEYTEDTTAPKAKSSGMNYFVTTITEPAPVVAPKQTSSGGSSGSSIQRIDLTGNQDFAKYATKVNNAVAANTSSSFSETMKKQVAEQNANSWASVIAKNTPATPSKSSGGSSASSAVAKASAAVASKPKEAPSYANGGIKFSGGTTQSKPRTDTKSKSRMNMSWSQLMSKPSVLKKKLW
jgi:hypothetical protein